MTDKTARMESAVADLTAAGWSIDRLRGTGQWVGCIFISRQDGERLIKLIVAPHEGGAYGWIIRAETDLSFAPSVTRYGADSVTAVANMMARKAPDLS